MRDRLPEYLDPASLANTGRDYRGPLSIVGMQRLAVLLYDADVPEFDVRLFTGRDAGGIAIVQGEVSGVLHLVCQRCLGKLDWPVQLEFTLAPVANEVQVQRLGEQYEPLLIDDDRISVRDVVEDELLLALPNFPQHAEDDDCTLPHFDEAEAAIEADEKPNPFAVLESLKRN